MSTCQFKDSKNNLHTFIHIPKTGGQSITNWLVKHTNINRFGMHDTLTDLSRKTSSIGKSFAVVRNPYDRLVSVYLYQRDGALRQIESLQGQLISEGRAAEWTKKHSAIKLQSEKAHELGFKKFVEYMIMRKSEFGLITQSKYTNGVDTILKFESLTTDFENYIKPLMLKDYGYSLPHDNKSVKHNYKKFYDKETIKLVKEIFKDDFINFKYNVNLKTKY